MTLELCELAIVILGLFQDFRKDEDLFEKKWNIVGLWRFLYQEQLFFYIGVFVWCFAMFRVGQSVFGTCFRQGFRTSIFEYCKLWSINSCFDMEINFSQKVTVNKHQIFLSLIIWKSQYVLLNKTGYYLPLYSNWYSRQLDHPNPWP